MIGNRDLVVHQALDVPIYLQFHHCGMQESHPGQHYGFAMRPYQLIHFVLGGSGTLMIENRLYPVKTGQAFYIPAGASAYYSASVDDPWKYGWIGFFADARNPFIRRLFVDTYVADLSVPVTELEKELFSILAVTHPKAGEKESYREEEFPGEQFAAITEESQCLEVNSRMLHLFSELLKKNEKNKEEEKNGENYAADAKAYMDMYYGERLQIRDVAEALHIHPNYLSACFKKVYHQTPREYLNNLRMERACLLLGKTDYPVAVIAGTLGFGNPFQFSAMFKKHYGEAPMHYREHYKK